jgi:ribosomal protein S14
MELRYVKFDYFKRKFYIKYEVKSRILKSFMYSDQLLNATRYLAFYQKIKIIRIGNKNQHTNRCFESGRTHGIITKTRYSRFKFRTESYKGNIAGFQRVS